MRISKLMKRLSKLQSEHGNVRVGSNVDLRSLLTEALCDRETFVSQEMFIVLERDTEAPGGVDVALAAMGDCGGRGYRHAKDCPRGTVFQRQCAICQLKEQVEDYGAEFLLDETKLRPNKKFNVRLIGRFVGENHRVLGELKSDSWFEIESAELVAR